MCHILLIVVVLWLVGDDGGLFWACSPSAPVSGTGTGSLIPLPSRRPLQNLPSFPRRRESTGWMCGARHRHCGLDPQSRGVVTRHAEYLLDTTVAQARTGFKAVSTGWGIQQYNTNRIPLSLDGRGPKPVPVPDTGVEGEQDKPPTTSHMGSRLRLAHVTDCTRTTQANSPYPNRNAAMPPVILALRQYPQGGVTTRQHQLPLLFHK